MARRAAVGALVWCLALAAACNSIVGFDDLRKVDDDGGAAPAPTGGSGGGGGQTDATLADVDAATARCNPSLPFGAPAIVPELDGADETKTALMTPDELEIYYLRGHSAPFDLRHATRDSREAAWNEPSTEAFSANVVQLTAITVGGLKIYYWDVVNSPSKINSAVATRPALQRGWGPGTPVSGSGEAVTVVANDDAAYWAKYVSFDGAIEQAIFRGNLVGAQILSGELVAGLHVAGAQDATPVVVKNETVIYFSSRRIGTEADSEDVWRAERASSAEPFGAPVRLPELSSSSFDEPTWVSEDECVAIINRGTHFYVAQRPR